jgi:DNA-binding transcriptional MerR regulator
VRPVKRAGGRRYYRPDDVDLLKGIRSLLYIDGRTIKGVQKVLKERGLRHVVELGRGNTPQPQTLVIERPVVVEKIVYVEKPAPTPAPAKKPRPAHLRPVSNAMSLPFFDQPNAAPVEEPPVAVTEPVIEAVEIAEPETGLLQKEREKLDALLDELVMLKSRLQAARGRKV